MKKGDKIRAIVTVHRVYHVYGGVREIEITDDCAKHGKLADGSMVTFTSRGWVKDTQNKASEVKT